MPCCRVAQSEEHKLKPASAAPAGRYASVAHSLTNAPTKIIGSA